jgi:hypothetical protein
MNSSNISIRIQIHTHVWLHTTKGIHETNKFMYSMNSENPYACITTDEFMDNRIYEFMTYMKSYITRNHLYNTKYRWIHVIFPFAFKFILTYDFAQIKEFMLQINSCIQWIHRIHTHVSLQTNTRTIEYINSWHIWIHRLNVITYSTSNIDEFI